ncbi:vWA domain-containing protein [Dongia deserti]|uniref:vWA domain-containing protein n=1 Tax=Dongia deserti TaxID=2268030 RepID=UPI000E659C2B|nr:TROVE domain-containing protein [Dongia deserti]
MANNSLFASVRGALLPRTDTLNAEGAPAYAYEPRHKLAQLAVTGCLNQTFYADAEAQLSNVLALTRDLDPVFVAKCAIYARERGMKDMPAVLLATLSVNAPDLMVRVFDRVVDNGKMLRNFVQVMRSGQVWRKSLGSRPKALVANWLNSTSVEATVKASVGQSPSLADVIKMVHPKPRDAERAALFAWLIGRPYDVSALPDIVRAYEAFKRDPSTEMPDVPFQMLTQLPLSREQWAALAKRGGWQMVRMNLNTFARHGVFEVSGMSALIAKRLGDAKEIRKARVLPYQLLIASLIAGDEIPHVVRKALAKALEIAIANVPELDQRIVVCPDVSGSMKSAVTGYRKGATSKVRCVDVAALVAAAFLRRNPATRVLPFENQVVDLDLSASDEVLTNAVKLASIGGGGTNCSAPLARLNAERAKVDLVVFVSDNQSWVDATRSSDTGLMREWAQLKARNPEAKLVLIDLQPYGTTQSVERADVLNVGGFSDAVFQVVADFATGEIGVDHWVGKIEAVEV